MLARNSKKYTKFLLRQILFPTNKWSGISIKPLNSLLLVQCCSIISFIWFEIKKKNQPYRDGDRGKFLTILKISYIEFYLGFLVALSILRMSFASLFQSFE